MAATVPVRHFVPVDLEVSDVPRLEALYQKLLDRPLDTAAQGEQWLLDFSELASVVDEYGSRRYIDKSCHTDDEAIEKAYLHFVENVEPRIKPFYFRLHKKFLASPAARELTATRHEMLKRKWQADVDIFRDENVPLETQVTKLNNEYDKICGAMMVDFRGRQYTLQQLARFLEEPDRATRREAWELTARRRLEDRERIDALFDQIVPLRDRIARNAGLRGFRDYMWKAYKRFDYTPQDCLQFADAIADVCVPAVDELDRRRRRELGVESLRPWDLAVDPAGRPPLRPFDETDVNGLVDKVKAIFLRLSPRLADDFESLRAANNLDLRSRKGKQPGGYQMDLPETRRPFIFMNAAGLQRDIDTLLHEGGHAFHCLAVRDEPLMFLRPAPIEFCEVASMSMELLGGEHLDVFYGDADAARGRRTMLENILRLLPWVAAVDSFQHWVYAHPAHTREQRDAHWLQLMDRFSGKLDWSGHEAARTAYWQRWVHFFHVPFYYVEYGIAQLGALQLWLKSRQDMRQAMAGYRAALALGGTRPLPELFAAAGIVFDFSRKTLEPLIAALRDELDQLPA